MKDRRVENFISEGGESPAEPVTAPTLSQLQNMPKEALQSLLERVCNARWGEMALLSDDAAHDAVCLKLLQGGMAQSDINKALPALREWVDRRKGRAAQMVVQDVRVTEALPSELDMARYLIYVMDTAAKQVEAQKTIEG